MIPMEMKMKIKNNKLLALVAVMALALATVAAVSMVDDDSSAAYGDLTAPMVNNDIAITSESIYVIQGVMTSSIHFEAISAAESVVLVQVRSTFTGFLTAGLPLATEPSPRAVLYLDGVKNVNIMFFSDASGNVTITVFGYAFNDMTDIQPFEGTLTVCTGNATFGTDVGVIQSYIINPLINDEADKYSGFSGNIRVAAGDASATDVVTFKAANLANFNILLDGNGKPYLSGFMMRNGPAAASLDVLAGAADIYGLADIVGTYDLIADDVVVTVKSGAKINVVGSTASVASFVIGTNARAIVEGEIHVVWSSSIEYGEFISDGTVSVPGKITYESNPRTTDAQKADLPLKDTGGNRAVVDAAVYATFPLSKSIYIYTSFDNAWQAIENGDADVIYISGHVYITDDDLVLAPSDGRPIKIIVCDNSSLHIGKPSGVPGGPDSAKVTVPETTELTREHPGDLTHDDFVIVELGQLIYIYPDNCEFGDYNYIEPYSAVRIIRYSDFPIVDRVIYTDVATALNELSTSGDTVELLRDANLNADAEVKNGVTLDDMGKNLTLVNNLVVKNGGKVVSSGILSIQKELTIEQGGDFTSTGFVRLTNVGVLHVYGNFTAVNLNRVITTPGVNGVGTVYVYSTGVFTISGESHLAYLYINGTVNVTGAIFSVSNLVESGKKSELLSKLENSTAKVTGQIQLYPTANVLIWNGHGLQISASNFVNTSSGAAYQTIVTASVILEEGIGDIASGKLIIMYQYSSSATKNLDKYIVDYRDFAYGGWTADVNGTLPLGTVLLKDTPNAYIQFTAVKFTVTFSFAEGVNWIVDGINKGDSFQVQIKYGQQISAGIRILQGYEGTAAIKYKMGSGAEQSYTGPVTVTDKVVFTVGGISEIPAKVPPKYTLIEILLMIIVAIIAVIAVFIAIKMLRS